MSDNCTCPLGMFRLHEWPLDTCYCSTCTQFQCLNHRAWEKEEERLEATCSCEYKNSYHVEDQGGYETCYCETCEREECTYERQERKEREAEQEEKDFQLYKQLKTRFG